MAPPVLEFRAVIKRFGTVNAVDGVNFAVQRGEIFTLLGPSGCGKTTTLRLVAGLEEPDDGEIYIDGKIVAAPQRGLFLPPEKRQLGMVFQSYAIWPHLTVFENVAFPLRVRRESADLIRQRVDHALESVGLDGFADRGATQLSGGQQQRVALARALVYEPAVLLLDEPLSNLDAKLREQMRFELRALQRKLTLTILYVTHDQTEAMTLSDRIAVVNRGRFEQVGSPEEVYEKPATTFAGEFLGRTVTLDGALRKPVGGQWIELTGGGRLAVSAYSTDSLRDGAASAADRAAGGYRNSSAGGTCIESDRRDRRTSGLSRRPLRVLCAGGGRSFRSVRSQARPLPSRRQSPTELRSELRDYSSALRL